MIGRVRAYFGRGVARRLFLVFVLAALLPLAALALLSVDQLREAQLKLGDRRLAANAKAYGMAVYERILVAQDLATVAAQSPRQSDAGTTLVQRAFISLGTLAAGEDSLSLRGQPRMPQLDVAEQKRLAEGKAVLLVEHGKTTRFHLAFRPPAPGGGPIIVGELRPDYIWGSADLFPASTEFCVLEEGERVPLFCSVDFGEVAADAARKDRTRSTLLEARWTREGEPWRAVAWAQFMRGSFGVPDWVFVASQPERTQLEPLREFGWAYLSVVALAILTVAWFTVRQSRSITEPLRVLARRARAVGTNDFTSRVNLRREDEFGQLGAAFDQMTERLGRQFETITALSEIDRLILSQADTATVIQRVIGRMRRILPGESLAVVLFDHENPARAQVFAARPGEPAATERAVVLDEDERRLLRAYPGVSWLTVGRDWPTVLDTLREGDGQRALVLPFLWGDRLGGVLGVGFRKGHGGEDERNQVRDFADRVSVAIASAWRDKQLYLQAHFDPLTALPNRLLFRDRLDREVARCHREQARFAVLYVDLDRFKAVNDASGHTAGDSVLRDAARRLSACVREADTVSRIGGDEFTVLLTHLQRPEDAGRVAEEAIRRLSSAFTVAGSEVFLSASIGIALYPDDGPGAEDLLRNADTAMYRAKAAGRAQAVYFEERMNADAAERLGLDRDLRHALERGELEVHYQPLVDLASGRPRAAEALLRWNHPTRGPMPPASFIPIAEETGLIDLIGDWIIGEACRQLAHWGQEGLALDHVSVNVSPRQFRRREFAASVRTALATAGLAPSRLELEITEGLFLEKSPEVEAMLREIAALGVRVALDDFGTGFSSMAYLQRFPVDTIKIDRMFVEGMDRSTDARVIVAAVIAMSQALQKHVVAEGVGTLAHVEALRRLKCHTIQGYYVSRPLPAGEFAGWLRAATPVAAA